MAPARQRANLDDSRSEASSTRERQTTGAKGRRPANAAASAKDTRPTSFPAHTDAGHKANHENAASVSWSTMPLSILHEYRHVYNLPCPSAYSTTINSIVLSQGIGLQSPTSIAARRANLASSSPSTNTNTTTTTNNKRTKPTDTTTQSSSTKATKESYSRPYSASGGGTSKKENNKKGTTSDENKGLDLHRVSSSIPSSQGRVSKDHLATAVRKHFNNTAISEQDAIARFMYKVHEERKGREFRLRFQP